MPTFGISMGKFPLPVQLTTNQWGKIPLFWSCMSLIGIKLTFPLSPFIMVIPTSYVTGIFSDRYLYPLIWCHIASNRPASYYQMRKNIGQLYPLSSWFVVVLWVPTSNLPCIFSLFHACGISYISMTITPVGSPSICMNVSTCSKPLSDLISSNLTTWSQ